MRSQALLVSMNSGELKPFSYISSGQGIFSKPKDLKCDVDERARKDPSMRCKYRQTLEDSKKQVPLETTKRNKGRILGKISHRKKTKNQPTAVPSPNEYLAFESSKELPQANGEHLYETACNLEYTNDEDTHKQEKRQAIVRIPGRSSYEALSLPQSPHLHQKRTPERRTPEHNHKVSCKIQPKLESLSEDAEAGQCIYDDVIYDDGIYEDVICPSFDSNDLCTNSNLSLNSSLDEGKANSRGLLSKKQSSYSSITPSNSINKYTSNDEDARYSTTTASLSKYIPATSKTQKPPKPAPRTSLKSITLRTSQDNCLPRSRELPEIQVLLDEAWEKLTTSDSHNSSTVAVTNADFTARLLDSNGGRLQLQYHGVTLDIPPGALEARRMVYIHVQRSLELSPTGIDGFASPLVHCGTSGLKFKKPVMLTFPVHLEDSSAWEVRGVRTKDSLDAPWEDISESPHESLVTVKDQMCTMVVDHFTGFGLVVQPKPLRGASGESGTTQGIECLPLRVGVFLPSNRLTRSGHLQLRVRIWDRSQETTQQVEEAEADSKVIDRKCTLFLRTTSEGPGRRQRGLDVVVQIRGLNFELWEPDPMDQTIPYENFQPDPEGRVDVSVTFNLKLHSLGGEGGIHPLQCDFCIGQRAHRNLFQTIRAVVDIFNGEMRSETQINRFPNPMSTSGFQELCNYLEVERRWKLLADLFFGQSEGRTFEKWPFPSAVLLNVIFSRSATLEHLHDMLLECRLLGAANIVQDEMASPEGLGGHLEAIHIRGRPSRPQLSNPVQCSDDDRLHRFGQDENFYEEVMTSNGRRPVATESEWPPGSPGDLRSSDSHNEMAATGAQGLEHSDSERTGSTLGHPASRFLGFEIQHTSQQNVYEECRIRDNNDVERTENDHYMNLDIVRRKASLPKGYVKFSK
ncbi:uncharacterized protein LOC110980454 isoform X2 [Acanthaster planci]|nr:uncharacterized protein LOC110980454 isoform X2 [Acanthaster planci]XP_022092839.1 uncharacterized protein LOC110980454 isoform X2 [Acanthaster planci]